MFRIVLLLAATIVTAAMSPVTAAEPQSPAAEPQSHDVRQRPLNILLFTADDLHSESVGVFAKRPEGLTPNLDRFAAEGMRFDNGFVNNAICVPSRAIIATGLYGHNSGAMGFMKAREDVPDIITTFQEAGYQAGVLGKVGHSTPKNAIAWDYAFDQGQLGNGRSPELYYQRSRTFLDRCKESGKPFYFMVNSHDPHRPFCDPENLKGGESMPSKTYQPDDVAVPGFLPDLPGVRQEMSQYLNSVRRLDDTFGAVMQALEEAGFADNTLVLFISDNGVAFPFAKCNAYYHSNRTPLLVRWPGHLKPGSVNRKDFVSEVDFMPTFLEAAGLDSPKNLDGRSFLPLLKGQPQADRDLVYTQIDGKAGGDNVPMRAVQTQRFLYIYNPFSDGEHRYRNNNEGQTMKAMERAAETDPFLAERVALFRYRVPEEFYDLQSDPNCLKNLINDSNAASDLKAMQARLEAEMERTNDPLLPAFRQRHNRAAVDKVLTEVYSKTGPAIDDDGEKPKRGRKNAKPTQKGRQQRNRP